MKIDFMTRRPPKLATRAAILTLAVSFSHAAFPTVTIGPGNPKDTLQTGTLVPFSAEPGRIAFESFGSLEQSVHGGPAALSRGVDGRGFDVPFDPRSYQYELCDLM